MEKLSMWFLIFPLFLVSLDWSESSEGSVDLQSLGYDGTWEKFCDYKEMEKDFIGFSDHDVKRIRLMLCQLKKMNQFTPSTLASVGAYKYCVMVRPGLEDMYTRLRDKFNEHFARRIGQATSARPNDECYTKTNEVFHRECIGKLNPCIRMFQSLLSATCVKAGITARDISRYLVQVCEGRYISDQINWDNIFLNIKYIN